MLDTLKLRDSGTAIACGFWHRELDMEPAMRVEIAISIALDSRDRDLVHIASSTLQVKIGSQTS